MNPDPEQDFVIYPQRWFMLASFSLLSCSSAWIWITWAPISVYLTDMWDVPLSAVDDLSGVYMYVYVPCSFISLYLVVNHIGLRQGLMVGGICNCIGAYFRFVYFQNYRVVYAGTLICALAQTFTLSTPPLIAGNWFGANERATSTSMGILSNQLGTALGLGATVVFDFLDSATGELDQLRLQKYLELQFRFACIALIAVAIFAGDIPPTPPSRAAYLTRYRSQEGSEEDEASTAPDTNNEETPLLSTDGPAERETIQLDKRKEAKVAATPTYMESIFLVFRDFSSMLFVLSFGLTVGVYYTVPTFLSQLMPASWSPRSIGWLGVLYQLIGVIASFSAGRIIDITRSHRVVALSCLLMSFFFLAVYYFTTTLQVGFDLSWVAAIAIGCAGAALSAFHTVGIELGTSMSFPADEAASAGILESATELCGFLWVTIGGSMADSTELVSNVGGQIGILLSFCVFNSLVLLLCIRTKLKRPL